MHSWLSKHRASMPIRIHSAIVSLVCFEPQLQWSLFIGLQNLVIYLTVIVTVVHVMHKQYMTICLWPESTYKHSFNSKYLSKQSQTAIIIRCTNITYTCLHRFILYQLLIQHYTLNRACLSVVKMRCRSIKGRWRYM